MQGFANMSGGCDGLFWSRRNQQAPVFLWFKNTWVWFTKLMINITSFHFWRRGLLCHAGRSTSLDRRQVVLLSLFPEPFSLCLPLALLELAPRKRTCCFFRCNSWRTSLLDSAFRRFRSQQKCEGEGRGPLTMKRPTRAQTTTTADLRLAACFDDCIVCMVPPWACNSCFACTQRLTDAATWQRK